MLFDRAVEEAYELLGCGLAYAEQSRHSCYTAEVHLRYLRELHAGDPVRVTFQLLDFDAKRLHTFEQLFHAEDGWVAATSENMSLHVDMTARKTAAFPAAVTRRLAEMKASHSRLPRPEAAGRRRGRRRRRPLDFQWIGQVPSSVILSTLKWHPAPAFTRARPLLVEIGCVARRCR